MASNIELGEITEIDVKEIWKDEYKHFTPWLFDNIEKLEKILDIEIENHWKEKNVGGFQADIVAEDINGNIIVIENQLTPTDHKHLGQLLTYASGLEASTIVWITNKEREEHKKCIEWLNRVTEKNVNFFLLKIHVKKIGDSKPATEFEKISEPSEWEPIKEAELSETEQLRLDFWRKFKEYCEEEKTHIRLREPKSNAWYTYSIGIRHFYIYWVINIRKKRIGCKLIITRKDANEVFDKLREDKDKIESNLGEKLKWDKKKDIKRSTISLWREADISNEKNWKEMFTWLKEKGEKFYKVFPAYIKNL